MLDHCARGWLRHNRTLRQGGSSCWCWLCHIPQHICLTIWRHDGHLDHNNAQTQTCSAELARGPSQNAGLRMGNGMWMRLLFGFLLWVSPLHAQSLTTCRIWSVFLVCILTWELPAVVQSVSAACAWWWPGFPPKASKGTQQKKAEDEKCEEMRKELEAWARKAGEEESRRTGREVTCTYLGQRVGPDCKKRCEPDPKKWQFSATSRRSQQQVLFLWVVDGNEEHAEEGKPQRYDNLLQGTSLHRPLLVKNLPDSIRVADEPELLDLERAASQAKIELTAALDEPVEVEYLGQLRSSSSQRSQNTAAQYIRNPKEWVVSAGQRRSQLKLHFEVQVADFVWVVDALHNNIKSRGLPYALVISEHKQFHGLKCTA